MIADVTFSILGNNENSFLEIFFILPSLQKSLKHFKKFRYYDWRSKIQPFHDL